MRTSELELNRFLSRIMGTFIFLVVVWLATDCQAQRQRRWLLRGPLVQREAPIQKHQIQRAPSALKENQPTKIQAGEIQPQEIQPREIQPREIQPRELQEGPTNVHQHRPRFFQRSGFRFYDPRYEGWPDRFPKYIGGFHSSHYSNLGVPSGDKGFRGNGIYWAPW